MTDEENRVLSDARVTTIIALVILAIWAVSVVYGMFNVEYTPPSSVQAAVLIVVGGVLGVPLARKGRNNDEG